MLELPLSLSELPLSLSELPLLLLLDELLLESDDPPEESLELDEDPELELELPDVVATEETELFAKVVLFPIPFPASFAPILDKLENIGLSVLVIPYAVTAAAIHNTIIIELIIFDLSNFFPPSFVFNYNK